MSFPLSYSFFLFTLITGSMMSISSNSWFSAWVGLELNLMSFIPLITLKMNPFFSEASLKYFLIQALGSALLISSSLLLISFLHLSTLSIFLALLLKLAGAPFHFWFPQVMEGLKWPQIFLLSTLQKMAPLMLISYLMTNYTLIKITMVSAILSALIGSLSALNTMLLQKIMAFSSINHLSWMLVAISISDTSWIFYFIVYSMMLLPITSIFHKMQSFSLSNLIQSNESSIMHYFVISLNFLSLAGLPPMTGFIPKWFIIQIMINQNLFIPLFFLLTSALITLYFYLRISINFMLMFNPILNFNTKYKSSTYKTSFLLIKSSFNFLGLFFPLYLLIF